MKLPYLYQIIHTRRYKSLHLAQHCEVLERCYWQIKFRCITLSVNNIAQRIETLLKEEKVLPNLSTHVELRLYGDGKIDVKIYERSIYEGYTLRCFNPFATIQTYDNPMGDHPTSARRAAAELAHHKSSLVGADASVRCGCDGIIYSCFDSPLFGVKGYTVFSSPALPSVERSIAIIAIRRCGYEFEEMAIKKEQLSKFDELFWVDSFGITAISQCENRRYMSVMAEKIAAYLE